MNNSFHPTDEEKKRLHPLLRGKTIALSWKLTLSDFAKISQGFKPQDMDDRWIIYVADNILHCYRSWTGHEIFRVHLRKAGDVYKAISVAIEQDQSRFAYNDDAEAIDMLQGVLKSLFAVTIL